MAVNKNFVVKNGIEVAEDLIFANSDLGKVGIGSTIPTTTLDVKGQGIAAEDGLFTGIVTAISELNVGSGGTVITALPSGLIGLGTASPEYNVHIVRPNPEASGEISTSLYVSGDVTVSGRVQSNAITNSSEVTTANLNVTGIATVSSLEASQKEIFTQFDVVNSGSGAYQFNATGIGFTQNTNNPTLYLTRGENYRFSVNASGHPFYIKTLNSTGTGNAYNDGVANNGAAVGIVTFKVPYNAPDILHYNCSIHSSMHGEIRVGGSGAGVGVGSEGAFIGAGVTMIDFKSSNGLNTVDISSGIASVTVTTGASIGLVIALGG